MNEIFRSVIFFPFFLVHIVILSRSESLYTTKVLLQAGLKAGYEVSVIDPVECELIIAKNRGEILFNAIPLENIKGVIPRIGSSNTEFGANVVRHFEAMGVTSIVSSDGLINSRDKWLSFQIMVKNHIPVPNTLFASGYNYESQLEYFGKKPVIIKLLKGTHGEGVILCRNRNNALATAEALRSAGINFVFQEYIQEAKGTDTRVIVVEGEVVAAMKRISSYGEFRSNLHQGGSGHATVLSNEEKDIAISAAKAFGLDFCGVDLIHSKRGPLVLEVNSSAGLEGVQGVTGIDIAAKVIDFFKC